MSTHGVIPTSELARVATGVGLIDSGVVIVVVGFTTAFAGVKGASVILSLAVHPVTENAASPKMAVRRGVKGNGFMILRVEPCRRSAPFSYSPWAHECVGVRMASSQEHTAQSRRSPWGVQGIPERVIP